MKNNLGIRNTTLFDKIKAMDTEFSVSESAFYRYMRKLRDVLGINEKLGRSYQLIGDTKPRELSQVDMCVIWIRDISEKVARSNEENQKRDLVVSRRKYIRY